MRRFIERCLLIGGLAMVGVWAWSEVRYVVWQDWGNWAFDRRLHRQSSTTAEYLTEKKDQLSAEVRAWLGLRAIPTAPPLTLEKPAPNDKPAPNVPQPSIEHNSLIGRLTIPRLHLTAAVREGAEEDTLAVALGHIPATALPGQKGNVGIAGHRDKLFRGLREIRANDRIEFETLTGKYVYEVGSLQIVKPSDVGVLKAGNSAELTLVTCYPFNYVGSAPDRFIVKAHQLVSSPSPETPSEAQTAQTRAVSRQTVSTQMVSAAGRAPLPTLAVANKPDRAERGRISFNVPKDHSRLLAPGIWFGVTETDTASHEVNGWMWLMPDRRTIWLRNHGTGEPVVFYSKRDGKRRELRLTSITESSAAGYLSSSE
jgi:sortase A